MKLRALLMAGFVTTLAGCGSLLDSTVPAPQLYVLRPAVPVSVPTATAGSGSLLLQRPEAGPGLESERIVLLRSEHRFDFYAASQWAAPAPDIVASVMVDALRASGNFSAVYDDHSPYSPRYNLRCSLTRFEADYTSGAAVPTIQVGLDCTLGRHRDRELLGSFTAAGSAAASEDRLSAVVAAFDKAAAIAMQELVKQTNAALSRETPPAP